MGSRLVTLIGDPGVGKSRLARELAARGLPGNGGAYLVRLARVEDERPVTQAIVLALAIGEDRGRGAATSVRAQMRDRPLLLVLDDCERVRDGCAGLARSLLAACTKLTVLATSREPLAVPGERLWRVPPLAIPAPGEDRLEALEGSDAVALFCDRAAAATGAGAGAGAGAGFSLTSETASDVAEACRSLEGNPLATELAAAWVGELTPTRILEGLQERIRLGRADCGARGKRGLRSPESAILWSFELLSEPQKLVLGRLSALPGGITLEAARAACGGGGVAASNVFDLLAGLLDRSLVAVEATGGDARYRLPEAISELASERLAEAGGEDVAWARFAAWCLALCERAEPALAGPSPQEWLERLAAERDNVRAAIEHSLGGGRAELALRTAGAMAGFWRLRGYLREGASLLERCLAAATDAPAPARAKACCALGALAAELGDLAAARARGEESLRLAEQSREPAAIARSLELLGSAIMYQGDPAAAVGPLERSVAVARRAGDTGCLAAALRRRAEAHLLQGDPRGALALLHECFELARVAGDRQAQAKALLGQGWAAIDSGEYEVGEARIRLAEDLTRSLGDRLGTGESVFFLAQLARLRGDLEEAAELLRECQQLAQAMHAPLLEVRSLAGLAAVEMACQRYESARELFAQSISIARVVGLPHVLRQSLLGFSSCATAIGDRGSAETALREALTSARHQGDRQGTSIALYALATLARERGANERAGQMHAEALRLHAETGDPEAIARSLEGIAGAALDQQRFAFAVRLLGAADASWKRTGRYLARWPWEQERHQRDIAQLEKALGQQALREGWEEGAARPLQDVVAYALRGCGERRGHAMRPAGLTGSELDVARLVARGLSSPEAAEQLICSPRTVEAHLASVYRKLGIHSRRQLRQLAEQLPELGLHGA